MSDTAKKRSLRNLEGDIRVQGSLGPGCLATGLAAPSKFSRPFVTRELMSAKFADLQLAEERHLPDEDAVTSEFIEFLETASRRRHPDGVMRRFNQPRHAGCVEAELVVPDDLDAHLRVGIFARPATCKARVRFANASSATDRERDIRGMSITVEDVAGENLTPGATTQDFVLNSHPVMVAPDTREFMALLMAVEGGGFGRIWYFLTHIRAARIGVAARQHATCHLDLPYWSTTPYLFGEGRAVKYLARPTAARTSSLPDALTDDYLRQAMRHHLAESDASFDLAVQFQTDPTRMPIEDASVEWDAGKSPFIPVAQLRIPRQDFEAAERMAWCETAAFDPWHCLVEHRPLGNMNRTRRRIYPELARLRAERQASLE